MIKKSHLAPFKLAFYGLFTLYLVTDLYLCSGPLRKGLDRKLQEQGLTEGALRERNAVAKIYGEIITKDELGARFREELYLRGKKESDFTPQELFGQKIATLNRMVEDSLLRIKTKVNDMRRPFDKEELEREWQQFASHFPTEDTLDAALKKQGINRDVMKMRLEARLQQEAQIKANTAVVEPAEEDLKTAYDELSKTLPKRHKRAVSHIFFSLQGKEESAVKKQAEEVRDQISSGLSFADAAKKYSEDPRTAHEGGTLGIITDDRPLPGNLSKIVFELPDNALTLSQSHIGYHLFLAEPISPVALPAYEELRPELRNALLSLRKQKVTDLFLEYLKAEARSMNRLIIYPKNV